ncbi:uncharacterized protein ACIB01_004744 [Guaruba guarouba]
MGSRPPFAKSIAPPRRTHTTFKQETLLPPPSPHAPFAGAAGGPPSTPPPRSHHRCPLKITITVITIITAAVLSSRGSHPPPLSTATPSPPLPSQIPHRQAQPTPPPSPPRLPFPRRNQRPSKSPRQARLGPRPPRSSPRAPSRSVRRRLLVRLRPELLPLPLPGGEGFPGRRRESRCSEDASPPLRAAPLRALPRPSSASRLRRERSARRRSPRRGGVGTERGLYRIKLIARLRRRQGNRTPLSMTPGAVLAGTRSPYRHLTPGSPRVRVAAPCPALAGDGCRITRPHHEGVGMWDFPRRVPYRDFYFIYSLSGNGVWSD